jgi:hypothetical protein
MEQRKTALEQMKGQDKVGQGFKTNRKQSQSKTKRDRKQSESNSLAVHQNWETLVRGLASSSDDRLATLANALVSNRKEQAKGFVNLLIAAEDGSLDQQLIMQEYMERKGTDGQVPNTNVYEPGYDFDVEPEEDTDFSPESFDPRLKEAIDISIVTAGFYQSPIKSKQLNSAK